MGGDFLEGKTPLSPFHPTQSVFKSQILHKRLLIYFSDDTDWEWVKMTVRSCVKVVWLTS